MSNTIMELADVYAESEASTDPRYMTQHARAALQAEVERVERELAGTEAVTKAAALEIVSLRAELEAAKADAERMDWLNANGHQLFYVARRWYSRVDYLLPLRKAKTLREAIDAAMKGQPK